MQMTFLSPWSSHILSVLRILAAATFMMHGTIILFGWSAAGPASLSTLYLVTEPVVLLCGLLLVLGLFSRPVAFVLSGKMAFVYFMGHATKGFFPVFNGGEAAMLLFFVFLYIAAAGPGVWSLDAVLGKNSGTR